MPRDDIHTGPHSAGQRRLAATQRRHAATAIAEARPTLATVDNGEKDGPGAPDWRVTSFHKGVPHDVLGRPDMQAYDAFLGALTGAEYAGGYAPFDVPLGPEGAAGAWIGTERTPGFALAGFSTVVPDGAGGQAAPAVRNWESPLAGHQFVLEGPDPGDLAMAPAPALGGDELCAEMAEVYAMALLRDCSFERMADRSHPIDDRLDVGAVIDELAALRWLDPSVADAGAMGDHERRRRNARRLDPPQPTAPTGPALDASTLFRGSSPGAKDGPYVSQFLLIGNGARGAMGVDPKDARRLAEMVVPQGARSDAAAAGDATPSALSARARDGYVEFGAQRIDQRVNAHRPGRDHMTAWPLWLDVQNGANVAGTDAYHEDHLPRFVGTPRDLATYVHFDQLYQAYFNACLLMFAGGVPFDQGFPSGAAHATRGSFATWGGPHVLSLMTEVASRALKAVRRQKFQHHLRGRPEQIGGMLTLAASDQAGALDGARAPVADMLGKLQQAIPEILRGINRHNNRQNRARELDASIFPRTDGALTPAGAPEIPLARNYLLPMAFPEGSPMHASYGAGHATVAGACVTILKAFFEMSGERVKAFDDAGAVANGVGRPLDLAAIEAEPDRWFARAGFDRMGGAEAIYVADDADDRLSLKATGLAPSALTIEGELDKLAANISIGRNMAGVHFYTDYYDSLRMGERLAVGILQEQAATCCDPFTMRLGTFDGDQLVVAGDGAGGGEVRVRAGGQGAFADAYDAWWGRHAPAPVPVMP